MALGYHMARSREDFTAIVGVLMVIAGLVSLVYGLSGLLVNLK